MKISDIVNGVSRVVTGIGSSIMDGAGFALKALRANYEHLAIVSLESNPPDRKKLSTDNPIGYFFASLVTYPITIPLGWVFVPAIAYFAQGLLYNARAGLNFILSTEDQIKLGDEYKNPGLNAYTFYSFVTGGFFLGIPLGIGLAVFATAYRLVADAPRMMARAFRTVTNAAWYEPYKYEAGNDSELLFDHPDDNVPGGAHPYWGFLGTIVGAVGGVIAIGFIFAGHGLQHNGAMLKRTFNSISNLLLHEDEQRTKEKKYELYNHDEDPAKYNNRQWWGAPGSLLGLIAGVVIVLPAIFIARSITNSARAAARTYRTVVNGTLYDPYKFDASNIKSPELLLENRDGDEYKYRNVWGWAGIILGGGLGIIATGFILTWHGLQHSGAMFKRTLNSISNVLLHEEDQLTKDKYELYHHVDPAKYNNRQWWGAPGSILGLIAGAFIVLPTIFIVRSIRNTARTTARTYRWVANGSLYEPYIYNDRIPNSPELLFENDDGEKYKYRNVWGWAGILIGGGAGILATGFILAGHGLQHSGAMFKRTFNSVSNILLHEDEQRTKDKGHELYNHEDQPKYSNRQWWGSPGSFFGLIAGVVIALPVIFIARSITNSARATARTYRTVVNGTLYDPYKYEEANLQSPELLLENRDGDKYKYRNVWGWAGILIGGGAGIIATGFILVGHGLQHTGAMFLRTSNSISNVLLHEEDQLTKEKGAELYYHEDPPKYSNRQWWGAPGSLLGLIAGVVIVLPTILIGRIITNSIRAIARTYRGVVNVALYEPYKYEKDNLESPELLFDNHDDDKHKYRNVWGWPGIVIGAIGGVIATGLIFSWHGLQHSGAMFKRSFYSTVNWSLHADHQFTKDKGYELFDHVDDAKYDGRKGLGFAGIFFGGLLGILLVSIIAPCRVIGNACISWKDYSGGYLNMGIEYEYFKTIPDDIAQENYNKAGIPGKVGTYIGAFVATFTVGIVALGIYAVRQLPLIFLAVVGFMLTPAVGIGKLLSKATSNYLVSDARKKNKATGKPVEKNFAAHIKNPPRFPNVDPMTEELIAQDRVEENFKRLYAALDFAGRFEEGREINHTTVKDGAKPLVRYMVKAATWDAKSLTETTLDNLLVGYRKFHDRMQNGTAEEYQQSEEYKQALVKTKSHYDLSYPDFSTPSAKKQRDLEFSEIEAVADQVITFLTQENKSFTIEKTFYRKYEMPMLESYFNKGKAEERHKLEQQLRDESAARYAPASTL